MMGSHATGSAHRLQRIRRVPCAQRGDGGLALNLVILGVGGRIGRQCRENGCQHVARGGVFVADGLRWLRPGVRPRRVLRQQAAYQAKGMSNYLGI
jgi:hypothetical protein